MDELRRIWSDSAKDYLMDAEPFKLGFGLALLKHLLSKNAHARPSMYVFLYEGKYFNYT